MINTRRKKEKVKVSSVTLETGGQSRMLAGLSYLGILCFVPLIMGRDGYTYFHARQGMVLWVWAVLAIFLTIVPGIGTMFFSISIPLIVIASLAGMVAVLMGKAWRIPVVYSLANRF